VTLQFFPVIASFVACGRMPKMATTSPVRNNNKKCKDGVALPTGRKSLAANSAARETRQASAGFDDRSRM
jgi:hypothetical protein